MFTNTLKLVPGIGSGSTTGSFIKATAAAAGLSGAAYYKYNFSQKPDYQNQPGGGAPTKLSTSDATDDNQRPIRVLILGGGVMGGSTAWALAKINEGAKAKAQAAN